MSFEPENDLERSLVRAAADPSWQSRFHRDLLAADIYFVEEGPPPERPGWRVAGEGAGFRVAPVVVGGRPYLPIFSSVPRLQAAIEREVSYIGISARTFLEITRGADVLLDPGTEFGRVLTAAEIAGLLDGPS